MIEVFSPVEKPVQTDVATTEEWSGIELALVVKPGKEVYIEWPAGEPMVNVIAMMQQSERGAKGRWATRFDPEDPDLLVAFVGGYRLYGMFLNDLI